MKNKVELILDILNTSEYDWMTVLSVSQESHIPEEEVKPILESLARDGKVVKLLDEESNTDVYTSKERYHRLSNVLNRILRAAAGKIGRV